MLDLRRAYEQSGENELDRTDPCMSIIVSESGMTAKLAKK